MKKITLILIIFIMLFTIGGSASASNGDSVIITVNNSLPFSVYKVVSFSHSFNFPVTKEIKFALFDKGKELPLQITSIKGNAVNFKTVLSLKPAVSKILVLKFGKNIKTNYKNIFAPNFSGTKFLAVGSGNLFIVSLKDNNKVKVVRNNGDVIFDGTLSEKETKVIPLPDRDTIFSITSSFPIFAEVSSLKPDCLKDSSDDVSSVFGTYFVLYIPKEVVVSSYATTHLSIKSLSGKTIYSQVLPARGQYKNFNLQPGFYEISADNPVTVQFGCEDDNIYAVNYGSLNSFKGVSYGNVVCSALFPNTTIRIKTASNTYPEITLTKRGDFTSKTLIKTFKDNNTETMPVYITYSNPVLIYSDANHGNIGGEQIPSIYGNGKVFSFLTGKIFNFNGLVHRRKIVVIPSEGNTSVVINGKKILLEKALSPKVFLFPKSYTPVNITSDKPVSVFDVGMTTSIEFLSMLLPIKDSNSLIVAVGKPGETPSGGVIGEGENRENPGKGNNGWISGFGKYLSPISSFFVSVFNSAQKVPWIKNVFNTLSEFNASISPYLRNLSKQIISLFMPAAQMVYPYVHNYLPNVSQEQLAAIIFYILIAFIIILLIPKRKKRKLPVVKIKEESDIKKKTQVAFNVKTIEEKGPGVKFGAPGRPKTLPPKKREEIREKHNKAESPNSLPTQAPPFRRASVKPSRVSEKPEELSKRISSLYKKPGASGPGKTKVAKVPERIVKETEDLSRKEELKQDVSRQKDLAQLETSSAAEIQKGLETKEPEKAIISKEKSLPVKESAGGLKEKGVSEKHTSEETEIKEVKHTEPEKPIVKEEQKEQTEKKPESAFSKIFKRARTEKVQKKHVEEKEESAPIAAEKEGEILEKPSEEKEEVPIRTSLDELLARVKEVTEKQEANKGLRNSSEKESVLDAIKNKEELEEKRESEELGAFGIKIANSIVVDKDSVDLLVKRGFIRHMNRIFISAKDQAEIDSEIKEKYRFGVISLTPIELRIAEDLARRISAKKSTGEILLIARKVGVKQILVNDNPKIKEYQGIRIVNVQDIAE